MQCSMSFRRKNTRQPSTIADSTLDKNNNCRGEISAVPTLEMTAIRLHEITHKRAKIMALFESCKVIDSLLDAVENAKYSVLKIL